MPWPTSLGKNKPRLLSLPSLAIVAVSGVAGGAALAALEHRLQQQGLPQFLLIPALPGLALAATSGGVLAAVALVPYIKRSLPRLARWALTRVHLWRPRW